MDTIQAIIYLIIGLWAAGTFVYCWFVVIPKLKKDINERVDNASQKILEDLRVALAGESEVLTPLMDEVLTRATAKILASVKEDPAVAKYVKDYMNGISLAFVNIICSRFGIKPEQMKELIKNAGGSVDDEGNIDLISMIKGKALRKLPELIQRGMDSVF